MTGPLKFMQFLPSHAFLKRVANQNPSNTETKNIPRSVYNNLLKFIFGFLNILYYRKIIYFSIYLIHYYMFIINHFL